MEGNANSIGQIQEQHDHNKYYVPSFFRINLGHIADFADISNIPFGVFSAFLHEYVHFLQDITTLYGLMVLGNTTYYIRDVASRLSGKKGGFTVPKKLSNSRRDFGYSNSILEKLYKGELIKPMRNNVKILSYEIKHCSIDYPKLESVVVNCRDNTEEPFSFLFGGNILTEGMAYMIQRLCYDSVYVKEGVPLLDLSDYPYMIDYYIANTIYPELAVYKELIIGIADISLLTYNPGLTFVRFMEKLRDEKFLEKYTEENMHLIIDDLYDKGHKFVNWSLDRFKQVQDNTFAQMTEYFKMPIASELNDWVQKMWNQAFKLRELAPHYILDLILANNGDVRTNQIFISIYRGIGTPLIINGDNEGFISPPQGFAPSADFMPGFMWAVDEISRIFSKQEIAVPCQLYDYCNQSSRDHETTNPYLRQTKTDDRCKQNPWIRALDDNALCPVAAIWRHWNLKDCYPEWQ
ncbi:MAG: hypothetical protein KA955_09920 [Prevotella sp.]|nr:hypothetical protein [Prevotella sp.]